MAKPNYQFEKRQRELEKKRKKEEKARQKADRKANPGDGGDDLQDSDAPATGEASDGNGD